MTVAYVIIAYATALLMGVCAFVVAALVAPGTELFVASIAGPLAGIGGAFATGAILWRRGK